MYVRQNSNEGSQWPVFCAKEWSKRQEYRISDAKEGVEAPNFGLFAQNFFERRP